MLLLCCARYLDKAYRRVGSFSSVSHYRRDFQSSKSYFEDGLEFIFRMNYLFPDQEQINNKQEPQQYVRFGVAVREQMRWFQLFYSYKKIRTFFMK